MSLALESTPPAPGAAPGFSARGAIAAELGRAGLAAAALPFRSAALAAGAARRRDAFLSELERVESVRDVPVPTDFPERPLRLFVASAEASGERHAVRLIQSLRSTLTGAGAPAPEILALGSARTRALGVETIGDPLERAAMGLDPIRSVPYYARLLAHAGEALARFRPDLVIPVDSPALFVPLARVAARAGARSAHFVAPQYWAWAPWRAQAYRKAFTLALTILPFEPAWWRAHGMPTAHVGHPALDGLPPAPAPDSPERRSLVLLPGSRAGVIARNLPWMLERAGELHGRHPELEIVLAQEGLQHRSSLEAALARAGAAGWIRLELGDLHGSLARARAALSVSGTVLIDLLHHRLPAAVIYRLGSAFSSRLAPHLLTVPWFSSVNLLARAPVYWEACFHGAGPGAACLEHLERSLHDPGFREGTLRTLKEAAERLGPAGATERAARHLLAAALS